MKEMKLVGVVIIIIEFTGKIVTEGERVHA